ncbi:MAG: substrate-binding periplasmic protein [Desulfovibrio sp.]
MKCIRLTLYVFCLCFFWNSTAFSEPDKLCFAEGEWPPYVSETLPEKGFATAIIRAVVQEMGMEAQLDFYSWERALYLVQKGEVPATYPWIKNDVRGEYAYFSDPIHKSDEGFYYLKERFPDGVVIHDIEDLNAYFLGGIHSYWYLPKLVEAGLSVDLSYDAERAFVKLGAGRFDLLPVNKLRGTFAIYKKVPLRAKEFGFTPNPFAEGEMRVMFSKAHPDALSLMNKFNAALKRLRENGGYERVLDRFGMK